MENSDLNYGLLLDYEEATLDEIFDRKSGTYYLYPEAPFADEVRLSKDIKWGIIDSGVLSNHPQLQGIVLEEKDFTGEGIEDQVGHGTKVALIGTYGYPIATKKPIQEVMGLISAKVARKDGNIRKKDVIKAIHWLAKRKVRVINLSLGFMGTAKEHKDLCKAINSHPNIMFFAAAGNFGPDIKVYPAACEAKNLISVAEAINDQLAPHSGLGDVAVHNPPVPVSPAEYYLGLGLKAARAEQFEKAKKMFWKNIEIDGHPEAWSQLGLIDLHQGEKDTALEKFMQAQKIGGPHPNVLLHIGAIWLLKENFEEALVYLRKTIDFMGNLDNYSLISTNY